MFLRAWQWLLLVLVGAGLASPLQAAAPAAGVEIHNQAAARFQVCLDDHCQQQSAPQRVTSNLVVTQVQAVHSFTLLNDQTRAGAPGGRVHFAHLLTNTGNDRDRYRLCVDGVAANMVASWQLRADQDRDGQPDDSPAWPLDSQGCTSAPTDWLAAGDSLGVVVVLDLASSATGTTQFNLRARSVQAPTLSQSNLDKILLSNGVLELAKRLDRSDSHSPGGPVTVTLTWRNSGSSAVDTLVLEDVLPTAPVSGLGGGMAYVPGSGRWSLSGNSPLTDAATTAEPIAGLNYCAYDPNGGSRCRDRVRLELDRLEPGDTVALSFQVHIPAGLQDGDRLLNSGHYFYHAGHRAVGSAIQPLHSNTVSLRIISQALQPAVVANDSNIDSTTGADDQLDVGNRVVQHSAAPGSELSFTAVVWNTGDGDDRFDLELDNLSDRIGQPLAARFPEGTFWRLLRADGETPLTDSDGSGGPDTGVIPRPDAAGLCPARFVSDGRHCGIQVVVRAGLPAAAVGGPFEATLRASSALSRQANNAVTLVLEQLAPQRVDLTNDRPGAQAPGAGAGPEPAPVTVRTVAPSGSTTLVLVVNNVGAGQDSYTLDYSHTLPFVAGRLPDGWQLSLRADGGAGDCSAPGALLTQTGLILAGQHQVVCAEVTAPTDAAAGTQSFYFRARSASSGAEDIKHDAVQLALTPALSLMPDQHGQVMPGQTVVYSHRVVNSGSEPLQQVLLSAGPDAAQDQGWSVALFQDRNGNGVLDAGDTLLTADTPLVTAQGTTLAVGEQITVFARVFAPATAGYGVDNIKLLTAQGSALYSRDGHGAALVVSAQATDRTTVGNTQVALTKEQALDRDCNGIADGPGQCQADGCYTRNSFPVAPGQCVLYRLTALNQGGEPINAVIINDRTQAYTTALQAGPLPRCQAPRAGCSVSAPADGDSGTVRADLGSLMAGEQGQLEFGLRVQ